MADFLATIVPALFQLAFSSVYMIIPIVILLWVYRTIRNAFRKTFRPQPNIRRY